MGSRQRRGRTSEFIVARHLQANGFPEARANGPYTPGPDILGVPEYSIEVKARRGLSIDAWLKQAKRQGSGTPLLVVRLPGQGEASIEQWPVIMRLGDFKW